MALNSMNENVSHEEIKEMQEWLVEHPIDHAYDEACSELDSNAPIDQLASRCAYKALKELGKLPLGIE